MACLNKNRHRPKTVAFRLTEEENTRLNQRVLITGEVKGDFLRNLALKGEIRIVMGKYKSEKLAKAINRLSDELHKSLLFGEEHEMVESILECQAMILELNTILTEERGA